MECETLNTPLDRHDTHIVDHSILPSYDVVQMYLGTEDDCLPQRLWDIAEKSEVCHQAIPQRR